MFSLKEMLKNILKKTKEIQDYLLVFYLERGLYHEAYSMTKDIRSSVKWQRLRTSLVHSNSHEDRKSSMKKVITVTSGFILIVLFFLCLNKMFSILRI